MAVLQRAGDLVKVVPDGVLGELAAGPLALADDVREVTTAAVLHQDVDDAAVLVQDLRGCG